jgi:crotonobetainyl-CoA:carnitine CoA-transferase CaiB-like acyl-CoA transferase
MSPFTGVRVLDLGSSWAGPFASMVLADLGADVIKLESVTKLDILRWSGSFADGVRDYEYSGYYAACNRGKRSITLNLKHARARELVLDLAAVSDVVVENFAPRVLPGLGLDYPALRARNPDLVMVSMSGYGATGPSRDWVSYGDHLMQASGFAAQTGHPEDPPTMVGTFYGDPVGGLYAALGVAAALAARDRGAGGCWLDLSQLEALTSLMPVELLQADLGLPPARRGEGSAFQAPQGFYACRGDDAWVALAVRTDEEWARLRALLRSDGIMVASLETVAERLAAAADLDRALGGWTATRAPWQATMACQAIGVPAHPVHSAPGQLRDDHLAERGFFRWVHRPVTGPAPIPGVTIRMAGGRSAVRGYAPLLGEHNEEVLIGLLGLPREEFDGLRAAGVIA